MPQHDESARDARTPDPVIEPRLVDLIDVAARAQKLAKRVNEHAGLAGADVPDGALYASDAWLMSRAGVHRTTVMRWRTGQTTIPPVVRRLVELELHGRLELIHGDWAGFVLGRDGKLYTPSRATGPGRGHGARINHSYTPGELQSIPWRLAQGRAADAAMLELRRENAELRRRIAELEGDVVSIASGGAA